MATPTTTTTADMPLAAGATGLPFLSAAALKQVVSAEGPWFTLVLPAHRPGSGAGARRAQFESLIQTAAASLQAKKSVVSAMAEPLKELANSAELEAGGPGIVVLRSPNVKEQFSLRRDHPPQAWAGMYPALAPFIPEITLPTDFFVLGFARKNLRLYQCTNGRCQALDLPAGVPDSVESAEAFKPSEHEAGRAASGPDSGGTGVHFGTLSDREAAGEHLHYFITTVDRGLREALAGKPLLLTGVHEELSAFRRFSRYEHLMDGEIPGSTEALSLPELAARATREVEQEHRTQAEKAVAAWREMTDRTRAAGGSKEVLRAAREARVHRLFIPETPESGDTEHVNAALAMTLKNGGSVTVAPVEALPEGLAAILRY